MSNLNSLIADYCRWFNLLTAKVAELCHAHLYLSVVLFLINQVSQVLVVFIPLKLLIVIGSEGVPRFIRPFIPQIEQETLIIGLASGAGIAYFLYLLSDMALNKLAIRAGRRIVEGSDKISLFDNQQEFSKLMFTRVARTWGGVLMVVGGMALGYLLDWRIYAVLTGLLILEYTGMVFYWRYLSQPRQSLNKISFINRKTTYLQGLSAINFGVVFLFLVYFFWVESYSFIVGIIIILLTRQVMIRFTLAFNDAFITHQQKEKISALYFSDVKLIEVKKQHEVTFVEGLLPQNWPQTIADLNACSHIDLLSYQWQWVDSGVRNIACYLGQAEGHSNDYDLLLKLYPLQQEKNYHSDKLIREELDSDFALNTRVIDSGESEGKYFLLVEGPFNSSGKQNITKTLLDSARQALWCYPLPEYLHSKVARSTPMVHERLEVDKLAEIRVLGENPILDEVLRLYPRICPYIDNLPTFLFNRALNPGALLVSKDGEPKVSHWHALGVEPLGMGMRLSELDEVGEEILSRLRETREDCQGLSLASLKLVSTLAVLEGLLNGQKYSEAAQYMEKFSVLMKECLDGQ
ncbi:hypothetical protein HMF8227_00733 [Saliniradius amylolyticus]|uniref:Uncharacterized protein n=1 Tax=Saliniradius amylolyticus TaxID=2183582 RepID=A0A2S2E0V8_9ALTE|nr:hypothetical protein [Saliniradius amylolyticus]AWL11229.1 hypothetical protein HMF8227_00733 [Saliniradius amylolyticus]